MNFEQILHIVRVSIVDFEQANTRRSMTQELYGYDTMTQWL